ncbi:unnamed protein product [Caenorhabditis nigoni]
MAPPLEAEYDNSFINKSNDAVTDLKWQKMFPSCVADVDQSSNFMTRAIFVVFSTILSRRKILPDDYFAKNHITEKLKCSSMNFKNPEALKISQLLRVAGNAVKMGYLKELALVITEHEGDVDAIEVYSIKFHYFENGGVAATLDTTVDNNDLSPMEKLAALDYNGTPAVRDQLVMLVRSVIYLCEKVFTESLPKEFDANFRVDYTDLAPVNFRIDGFFDSSTFYTLPKEIQSATLGHLRPGHHAALFDCSSIYITDTYAAELSLKAHTDKVADKLGYSSDGLLYKSFSSDPNVSITSNGAVKNDSTVESLANSLAKNTTLTPMPAKSARAKDPSVRAAPYSKRTRK